MCTTTTELSTLSRHVWVQREGRRPMLVFLEPSIIVIDQVKALVFGMERYKYQTLYGQQELSPGAPVPSDSSARHPLKFKRIVYDFRKCFYAAPANKSLAHCICVILLFLAPVPAEGNPEPLYCPPSNAPVTRTMLNNRQSVLKCAECLDKFQTKCMYTTIFSYLFRNYAFFSDYQKMKTRFYCV